MLSSRTAETVTWACVFTRTKTGFTFINFRIKPGGWYQKNRAVQQARLVSVIPLQCTLQTAPYPVKRYPPKLILFSPLLPPKYFPVLTFLPPPSPAPPHTPRPSLSWRDSRIAWAARPSLDVVLIEMLSRCYQFQALGQCGRSKKRVGDKRDQQRAGSQTPPAVIVPTDREPGTGYYRLFTIS